MLPFTADALDITTDDHPLAHLKACPKCPQRVGMPVMCKGREKPEHVGYWYETCLDNASPTHTTCTYFTWRSDLATGKAPGGRGPSSACPGRSCRQSTRSGALNADCTFGLCSRCCAEAQRALPGIRRCVVSRHNKLASSPESGPAPDIVAPSTDLYAATCVAPVPPRPWSTAGYASLATVLSADPRVPSTFSNAQGPSGSHQASPPLPPGPIPKPASKPSYRVSISPLYQQKLSSLEMGTSQRHVEDAAAQAEHDRASQKVITLYWWAKADVPAEIFQVLAPSFPYFHPKQSPELVELFQTDKSGFQFFDWKLMNWVYGTVYSPLRNIKAAGGDLHYRSKGVTAAPGMPAPLLTKRSAYDADLEDASRPSTYRPVTPSSLHATRTIIPGLLAVPLPHTPSTPTPSRSQSDLFSLDAYDQSAPSEPALSPSSASYQRSFDSVLPPLPALVFSPQLAQGGLTPTMSPSPALSTEIILLSGIPPRGRSGWPLKYVCDMGAGFDAVRRHEDAGANRETAFAAAFEGHIYKRSTFSDNFRAWIAAGAIDGEQHRWIQSGRSDKGEWALFMKRWNTKSINM